MMRSVALVIVGLALLVTGGVSLAAGSTLEGAASIACAVAAAGAGLFMANRTPQPVVVEPAA